MRLYIHADKGNKPMIHFPWDYHLSMTSFIYESLGDENPERASELHQMTHAPPFSFSNFIQTGPFKATRDGLFFTKGYFVISSIEPSLISSIKNYLPATGELHVGNTCVPIVGQTVEDVTGVDGVETYRTLSPIAIGELPYNAEEGPREWYLPTDSMWAARLKESVRENMRHTVGLPDNFKFKVKDYNWVDKKTKRLTSDIEIPCARTELEIDLDEKTSKFIQEFGLGERTGMGFGNMILKSEAEIYR